MAEQIFWVGWLLVEGAAVGSVGCLEAAKSIPVRIVSTKNVSIHCQMSPYLPCGREVEANCLLTLTPPTTENHCFKCFASVKTVMIRNFSVIWLIQQNPFPQDRALSRQDSKERSTRAPAFVLAGWVCSDHSQMLLLCRLASGWFLQRCWIPHLDEWKFSLACQRSFC